jgi:Glycosyl hydrolases family 38 N-terminal domain
MMKLINTHYYAMLDQLTLGHQWLLHHIGPAALPKSGWAIDPFGHIATIPYLLQASGLENMLIQRTYYEFKHILAEQKKLV